ncbi:MAG: tRNA lysidine(34) synthetase TilS [Anaerolineales bacterium]|nr:tRNA lysidine(34) synthetase TilS [Anaerolineales bacterium]
MRKIETALEKFCYLDRRRPVLAGISGGPDSLCLLEALYQLDYPLIVAHLDHQLRPGSRDEAVKIRLLAGSRGLKFEQSSTDIRQFSIDHRQSIEEAARNVRYRFLFEQAHKHGAQAVATGHTADDLVETVLMHLLRGSGMAGLNGMEYHSLPNPWDGEIALVRPLLGVWRSEILGFLSERGLEPVIDESNQDLRYYRNRLRHELIPHLESLNPGAARRIWQTSSILGQEELILQSVTEQAWSEVFAQSNRGAIGLDREKLIALPLAIRRRLIRKAISMLRSGLRDINFDTIERALDFAESPTKTLQADLASGLRIEFDGKLIWLADWQEELPLEHWPGMDEKTVLTIPIPGTVYLAENCTLSAGVFTATDDLLESIQQNQDRWLAWLDLDRLDHPLQVRTRLPGERFHPFGMQGHSIKLSDYMINQHIPRRARSRWPLIINGERVAWVPGGTIGEAFHVQAETSRLLRLAIMKKRRTDEPGPALS